MTLLIQTALFLLGMGLCVQWVAALFGIIDCRYAIKTLYPRVVGNMLLWTAVIVLTARLASGVHRPAFLWGVAAFPVFHAAAYAGVKALMKLKARR